MLLAFYANLLRLGVKNPGVYLKKDEFASFLAFSVAPLKPSRVEWKQARHTSLSDRSCIAV